MVQKFIEEGKQAGIEILVLQPEQIEAIVNRDDSKSSFVNKISIPHPDITIPRMSAGTTCFVLALIHHLEKIGGYSFNYASSIDFVKYKLYQLQILNGF